jgi:class 3 adenylate cyclase
MNEPLANPGGPEGLSERSRAASDDRKLIAIIYADMVGYSRLVAIDDANTLRRFSTLRRDLIGPAVHDHAGRIIVTAASSPHRFSLDRSPRAAVLASRTP